MSTEQKSPGIKRYKSERGYDGQTRLSDEFEDAPKHDDYVLFSDHEAAMKEAIEIIRLIESAQTVPESIEAFFKARAYLEANGVK